MCNLPTIPSVTCKTICTPLKQWDLSAVSTLRPLYSAVQKQYPVTYTETALSTENNYRLAGQPEYSEVTSKTLQHPAQSNPPHVYFTLQQAQAGPPSEASPYEQPVVTMPRHDYDEVKKLQMSNEEHFYHHLNHT